MNRLLPCLRCIVVIALLAVTLPLAHAGELPLPPNPPGGGHPPTVSPPNTNPPQPPTPGNGNGNNIFSAAPRNQVPADKPITTMPNGVKTTLDASKVVPIDPQARHYRADCVKSNVQVCGRIEPGSNNDVIRANLFSEGDAGERVLTDEVCRTVTSNENEDIFVPFGADDFADFEANPPSGITVQHCCFATSVPVTSSDGAQSYTFTINVGSFPAGGNATDDQTHTFLMSRNDETTNDDGTVIHNTVTWREVVTLHSTCTDGESEWDTSSITVEYFHDGSCVNNIWVPGVGVIAQSGPPAVCAPTPVSSACPNGRNHGDSWWEVTGSSFDDSTMTCSDGFEGISRQNYNLEAQWACANGVASATGATRHANTSIQTMCTDECPAGSMRAIAGGNCVAYLTDIAKFEGAPVYWATVTGTGGSNSLIIDDVASAGIVNNNAGYICATKGYGHVVSYTGTDDDDTESTCFQAYQLMNPADATNPLAYVRHYVPGKNNHCGRNGWGHFEGIMCSHADGRVVLPSVGPTYTYTTAVYAPGSGYFEFDLNSEDYLQSEFAGQYAQAKQIMDTYPPCNSGNYLSLGTWGGNFVSSGPLTVCKNGPGACYNRESVGSPEGGIRDCSGVPQKGDDGRPLRPDEMDCPATYPMAVTVTNCTAQRFPAPVCGNSIGTCTIGTASNAEPELDANGMPTMMMKWVCTGREGDTVNCRQLVPIEIDLCDGQHGTMMCP